MLVPSMTPEEITKAVVTDWSHLISSTIPRLMKEYDKERRNKKINKHETFLKIYSTRSANKNPWITIMFKDRNEKKFKDVDSVASFSFTYLYTDHGFRVFHYDDQIKMCVFNGHLFRRFEERLNLNIPDPIALSELYFFLNTSTILRDLGNGQLIGITGNGITLGEYQRNSKWTVFKTFVPWNMTFKEQELIGIDVLAKFREYIESLKTSDYREYQNCNDTLNNIIGIIMKENGSDNIAA